MLEDLSERGNEFQEAARSELIDFNGRILDEASRRKRAFNKKTIAAQDKGEITPEEGDKLRLWYLDAVRTVFHSFDDNTGR